SPHHPITPSPHHPITPSPHHPITPPLPHSPTPYKWGIIFLQVPDRTSFPNLRDVHSRIEGENMAG
ncbi:hypothetical protein, partial [Leptolyngbya sp. PCC 6406]|uniref:hypothetical protein n=1 Tax=Leptolyngbya sp. PCC 6406 TaxID=1173264 RepID=UPI0021F141B0